MLNCNEPVLRDSILLPDWLKRRKIKRLLLGDIPARSHWAKTTCRFQFSLVVNNSKLALTDHT